MKSIRPYLPPTDEISIRQLEEKWQITLPDAYKNFLLLYNGGAPTPWGFNYCKNGKTNSWAIQIFLGISDTKLKNLDRLISNSRGYVPDNLIPIALAQGKDTLFMSVGGDDYGSVYLEVSDEIPDDEISTYDNMYFYADSFEAFLDNLFGGGWADYDE